MKTVNIRFIFSGVLATFILSGCAEPFQLYNGPKLPRSKIATIKFFWSTKELTIDGKDVYKLTEEAQSDESKRIFWNYIAILPGKHEVKWIVKSGRINISYPVQGILDAKAGASYQIVNWQERGRELSRRNITSPADISLGKRRYETTYEIVSYGGYIRRDDALNFWSRADWTPN